jgi:inorganic pyrophosphatase
MSEEFCADVFIEIAKNSHIKYEFDKEKNILVCDRILSTPFKYHFNYGFIPNTLSEDGDPIDAVVLMDDELIPGCLINCKIIGYLDTEDDKGRDPKLIMCPSVKIDSRYKNIQNITDLPDQTLLRIAYFFQHYKDLEHKIVQVNKFHGKMDAIREYESSLIKSHMQSHEHKNKITHYFGKNI